MIDTELHGIIVPLITPIDNNEEVDEQSLRKLVRFLIDSGVHGLLAGGSSSEAPLMLMDQWVRMMEIVFDETKGAVPLVGGVMDTSTLRIVERVKKLTQIGYTHFAVAPSYYITLTTESEYLRLYGRCKEVIGGNEMVVYNMPACVGSSMQVDTICEMARRGWTRYCKDSSGDFTYFKELVIQGRSVDLTVFLGTEAFVPGALLCGAGGVVPITANYEPKTLVGAYKAAVNNDIDELLRLDKRVVQLRKELTLAGSCWVSGTKYALSTLGIGNGNPFSPLEPLNAEQKEIVRNSL